MSKTTWVIIIIILVIGAGFVFLRDSSAPENSPQSLPDVILKDAEGNDVALTSFMGTPLVVNSWAVWCPFCKRELPDFAQVQKEFEGQVLFIAIDRAEGLEETKAFTDEIGVTDALVFLLDPGDRFYQAIGGFSMPETIFVDAQGMIVDHKRGPMGVDEIRQRVEKLL